MGRETKILLGFLGLLAGAFVGVLAAKLFVPRPPAGAGPDINTDVAAAESHELVAPPAPGPRAWDFAAAPPLAPAAPAPPRDPFAGAPAVASPSPAASPAGRYADRPTGRFGAIRAAPAAADAPPEKPRPAVTRVAWETPAATRPATAAAAHEAPGADPEERRIPEPALSAAPSFDPASVAGPTAVELPAAAAPVAGSSGGYVVRPGDSWWAVAAAAYGDGRLYRALFAWNRTVDPRIALAPGTRLEIPPRPRLEAAWPRLLPAPGTSDR